MADDAKGAQADAVSTATDDELAKAIASLESVLTNVPGEPLNKAVLGTNGGLQGETPTDGGIDKTIEEDEEEDDDLEDGSESDNPLTEPTVSGVTGSEHKVSPTADLQPNAGVGAFHETEPRVSNTTMTKSTGDAAFAKSLTAAFTSKPDIVEAAKGAAFAKALVMATIEGMSITHDGIAKSFAAVEDRVEQKHEALTQKVDVLAKGLAVIATALGEITKEIKGVSNAPVRPVAKSARVLNKSFGAAEGGNQVTLSKAQIAGALEGLVMAGKVDQLALAKFESAGEIDPALLATIKAGLAS